MKKIKKILPVLLGVMVLMFGSLTVCAAESKPSIDYSLVASSHKPSSEYTYCFSTYTADKVYFYYTTYPCYYNEKNEFICNNNSGKSLPYVIGIYTVQTGAYTSSSYTTYDSGSVGATGSFAWTDYTIYNGNDRSEAVFTPPAPLVAVAEVLPVEIQAQTKVILTIAIACLASLIILLVLPKKLPRFLNR